MTPIARYLFAAMAVLFVVAIVVQVFLAGLFLFAGVDRSWHENFGYLVELPILLALLVAWPAHVGRRLTLLTVASFVDWIVQTSLPLLQGGSAAVVAALHPVNALLMLWLGVTVATEALALARGTQQTASAPATAAPGGHPSMERGS